MKIEADWFSAFLWLYPILYIGFFFVFFFFFFSTIMSKAFLEHCFLGTWTCQLVSESYHLVWRCHLTETDINTRLANAWIAIDKLSVIWKSDLTDKIKRSFFQAAVVRYCYMDALHECKLNVWRKSLTTTTQECCEQYWTNPGGSTPQSSGCTATFHPSRKLSKLDEPDMWDTAGEVGTSS